MKKLSIVMPCYNCENTLKASIDSILRQKLSSKCELILINDGSKDNTLKILEMYSNKNNVIVYSQPNSGVSAARNKGIELSSSKYIMFVDSDDLLCDNALELIFKNLNKNKNSLFLYGISQEFYKNNKLIKKIEVKSSKNEVINLLNESHKIVPYFENNLLNGPYSKIFDLNVIKENDIKFNECLKIQEDLCFNIQYISKINSINFDTSIIYKYIILGSQSITSKFLPERFDNYQFVERGIFDFFDKKNITDKYKRELYFISVKNTWSSIINSFYPGNAFKFNGRKKFIESIISKCNYDIIKKSHRDGIKYAILKIILVSKNILLIYFFAMFFASLKRKAFISYK